MADMNDDDLLEALGVEVPTLKTATRTPREERIVARTSMGLSLISLMVEMPASGSRKPKWLGRSG